MVLAALGPCVAANGFTSATPAEFHLMADMDGDSRPDAVIVDRVSGSFRVGYQLAPGVLTWADARPSGAENLGAVTVGRLLGVARDVLAFAAPDANRVRN